LLGQFYVLELRKGIRKEKENEKGGKDFFHHRIGEELDYNCLKYFSFLKAVARYLSFGTETSFDENLGAALTGIFGQREIGRHHSRVLHGSVIGFGKCHV
jgi:hypothetical protein